MRRPSFQFYPGDWLGNSNLRRCTHAEKGCWLDVMCLMHDSSVEYGVLRWPLEEIALAVGCQVDLLKSLIAKGVLKGADAGDSLVEPFVYIPRSGRRDGEPVTLIQPQPGPVWYSSRMVRDDYVNSHRGGQTRFTAESQPGQDSEGINSPNRPIGDGKGVHPTIHPTHHHAFTTLSEESAESGGVGHGSLNSAEKAPKTSPTRPIGDGQGDGPSSSTSSSSSSSSSISLSNTSGDQAKPEPIPQCRQHELIRHYGEKPPKTKLPKCPHELVIGIYHDLLPELPAVRVLGKKRKEAIQEFWDWVLTDKRLDGSLRATTSDGALTYIKDYCNVARSNEWLMGRTARSGEHANWRCDIEFLFSEKGRVHVIEKTGVAHA